MFIKNKLAKAHISDDGNDDVFENISITGENVCVPFEEPLHTWQCVRDDPGYACHEVDDHKASNEDGDEGDDCNDNDDHDDHYDDDISKVGQCFPCLALLHPGHLFHPDQLPQLRRFLKPLEHTT